MAKIMVEPGDSLERALRRFKRLCEKEGIRREQKRASYYEKPSEQRRRKQLRQKLLARKMQRLAEQPPVA